MQNIQKIAMMKAIGFLATAMLINAASLDGQSVSDRPIGVTRNNAFERLGPHTRVRVVSGNKVIEGMFAEYTDEKVIVSMDSGNQIPIPFNAIDGMWKRSNSAGTGAVIGASVGGLALGSFGVLLVNGLCESSKGCSGDAVAAAIWGGAIGAAGGGVLRAGIGFLVKRWVRIDSALTRSP